jgi:hypothetical protein
MLQKLGQIGARESVLDEGFDEAAVQGQAEAAEEQVLHGAAWGLGWYVSLFFNQYLPYEFIMDKGLKSPKTRKYQLILSSLSSYFMSLWVTLEQLLGSTPRPTHCALWPAQPQP